MRACTGGERIQEACVTFILQSSRRSREFEGAGTITGGERGEKQVTNMVDSSYVGLFFLYQNIFKWLKKKEHGKKRDWVRRIWKKRKKIRRTLRRQSPGI